MSRPGRRFRRSLAALCILCVSTSLALSDDLGGTFLCIDEFGGGIAFDESLKQWVSAKFRPEGKVVIKATWRSKRPWQEGSELSVDLYEVSVTPMGENSPYTCSPYQADDNGLVATFGGMLNCNAGLSDYRVNLSNMRYTVAYHVGYVDGRDNTENTPSIMGGSCARIE